jgi:F-type H+-transporting ATPase subunit b
MPQLDPALFSPQIVWLIISFAALYFLMARLVMPRVAAVLEQREDRIQGNLDRAERIRLEAAGVLAAYEKAIAEARAQSHALLQKTAADIAAETAKREGEFGRKLADEGAAAEARIREAKTKAMAEIQGLASDVAAAMAAKLTGTGVDAGAAKQAVEQALRERQ